MFNLLSPVKDIMSKDLITIGKDATLEKVKEIFDTHKIHHIPVVEYKKLVGIISKSDFLFFQKGYNYGEAHEEAARLKVYFVRDIMTKGVAKLDVEDKVNVALEVFNENLFHAIPIEEEGELKGIVTTYDIINALAKSNGAVSEYIKAA